MLNVNMKEASKRTIGVLFLEKDLMALRLSAPVQFVDLKLHSMNEAIYSDVFRKRIVIYV